MSGRALIEWQERMKAEEAAASRRRGRGLAEPAPRASRPSLRAVGTAPAPTIPPAVATDADRLREQAQDEAAERGEMDPTTEDGLDSFFAALHERFWASLSPLHKRRYLAGRLKTKWGEPRWPGDTELRLVVDEPASGIYTSHGPDDLLDIAEDIWERHGRMDYAVATIALWLHARGHATPPEWLRWMESLGMLPASEPEAPPPEPHPSSRGRTSER
jgi:hypothetical protein